MCLPVVLAVVCTALTSWSCGKETRVARFFFFFLFLFSLLFFFQFFTLFQLIFSLSSFSFSPYSFSSPYFFFFFFPFFLRGEWACMEGRCGLCEAHSSDGGFPPAKLLRILPGPSQLVFIRPSREAVAFWGR
ncbi:hypothetical protein LX32DRAFT_304260 [Colletotrichum zoysiae]|uniref:Uncharacterized protein n=1 Tax=Colletotrichum zoysiae TaxID=1216348 RepID=A0AAD9LW74_9PEZI|nr:hypothetical protein LX32DRAFT_304260 [Colletotrichum zoysiae]